MYVQYCNNKVVVLVVRVLVGGRYWGSPLPVPVPSAVCPGGECERENVCVCVRACGVLVRER